MISLRRFIRWFFRVILGFAVLAAIIFWALSHYFFHRSIVIRANANIKIIDINWTYGTGKYKFQRHSGNMQFTHWAMSGDISYTFTASYGGHMIPVTITVPKEKDWDYDKVDIQILKPQRLADDMIQINVSVNGGEAYGKKYDMSSVPKINMRVEAKGTTKKNK